MRDHHTALLESIVNLLETRARVGRRTTLHKIRAHTNIRGNDLADAATKMAARNFDCGFPFPPYVADLICCFLPQDGVLLRPLSVVWEWFVRLSSRDHVCVGSMVCLWDGLGHGKGCLYYSCPQYSRVGARSLGVGWSWCMRFDGGGGIIGLDCSLLMEGWFLE